MLRAEETVFFERGKKSSMDDDHQKGNAIKHDESITDVSTTPLSNMANAFEELSKLITASQNLSLGTFCEACSQVSVLFGCLGIAFKFAEMEYVSKQTEALIKTIKDFARLGARRFCAPVEFDNTEAEHERKYRLEVRNLAEASKRYNCLQKIIDIDVSNDTVRTPGSHSRNLRRVRQGLDLIRELFHQFLSARDLSLKDAASTAYSQVCAPYHTWAVRTAVSAGMYALPSREQLLVKLQETDQSAEKKMRRYIKASVPVIEYIDKLYVSRKISLDW